MALNFRLDLGLASPPTLAQGVGVPPDLAVFADGTDGFLFDFSKTDRLWQSVLGTVAADDPGENIALAIEQRSRGRVNLFTFSEEFDNAAWPKNNATISANAVAAPDATNTADLIYPSSTGSNRRILRQMGALTALSPYTQSVYIKSAGFRWVHLNAVDATSAADSVWFDVIDGVVGTTGADATAVSISPVGDGWFRIVVSGIASATLANNYFYLALADADNSLTATASGTSGVYIWGAQLETGSTVSQYQRNGSTVGGPGNHGQQGTVSAQPKWQTGGLSRFDGSDDSLLTPLLPHTAMSLLFKAALPTTASTKVIMGSTGTGSGFVGYRLEGSDTVLCGSVGSQATSVIKGTANIGGTTGVGALTLDGSTVRLLWNGSIIYEAAQSGAPDTTIPIRLGAWNASGNTAGLFANIDLYNALGIRKALTPAEILAITNQWGTS